MKHKSNIDNINDEILLEARDGQDIPTELSVILDLVPNLKLSNTPQGWFATVKITERDQRGQNAQERAWSNIKSVLSKKPWKLLDTTKGGWDAQTDTGSANHTSRGQTYVSSSGLVVKLSSATNFRTGTKIWSLSAENMSTNESLTRKDVNEFDKFMDKILISEAHSNRSNKKGY